MQPPPTDTPWAFRASTFWVPEEKGGRGGLRDFLAVTLHLPSRDCEAPPWPFEILNQLTGAVMTKAGTYSRPAAPTAVGNERPGYPCGVQAHRSRRVQMALFGEIVPSPVSLCPVSDASIKGSRGESRESAPISTL